MDVHPGPHELRQMAVGARSRHDCPQNPDLFCEFMKGKFIVRKTKHTFSSMAMDQVHKQLNEKMKGTASLIGLKENPDAMLRRITSGPDVQRDVQMRSMKKVSQTLLLKKTWKHHEHTTKLQMRIMCRVQDFL